MKKTILIIIGIIVILFGILTIAKADLTLWYLDGTTLKPVDSTWAVDTGATFATTTINGTSGPTFTFATTSDTNLGLTISTSTGQIMFTPNWIGTLADGRIASAATWNAKQSAISFPIAVASTSLTGGVGLTLTTNDMACDTASASVFGCLTSANWTTFNSKWDGLNDMTLAQGNVYIGDASNNPVATSSLYIDTNGNVGIGTTTPAYTLDVYGTLRAFTSIQTASSSLGTVNSGTWQGTAIADAYIPDTITIANNATTGTALSVFAGAVTDGQVPDTITIVNNATTGTAVMSSLNSVGTITTGTWSATAIANTKGGTGQDTSGWTGIPKITAGTWATSTNVIAGTISINLINATTAVEAMFKKQYAITLTRVSCNSRNGTTTFNLLERTEASPNTGGTAQLSASLVCGVSGTASSTAFADGSIAANAPVIASTTAMVGLATTTTYIYVDYTFSP